MDHPFEAGSQLVAQVAPASAEPAAVGVSSVRRGFRELGRASLFYFLGNLLAKGAKFLLIPIYVHHLTRAEVGVVIYLEAVVFALSRFLSFGLQQAVKRFYVEYEDERDADAFVGSIFWTSLLLGAAVAALLAGGIVVLGDRLGTQIPSSYMVLAIALAAFESNIAVPMQRLVARQEAVKHSILHLVNVGTPTIGTVWLVVVWDMGVPGVLWGQLAGYGVLVAGWSIYMIRPAWRRFQVARVWQSFGYCLPVLPHMLFTWAITASDRLILERFVTLEVLGVYGIGYQLASLLPMFSLAVTNAWIARYFRTAEASGGAAEFARTMTYLGWCLFGLALALVAFAPELIRVIATSEYRDAATILRLVAIGLIFHGIYQALQLTLFYAKKTQWISVATGTALAVNVTMNLALIPFLGMHGAAFATIAAYMAASLVNHFSAQSSYPVPYETRRIVVAAGLASGAGGVAWLTDTGSIVADMSIKTLLLLAYPAVLATWPGLLAKRERAVLLALAWRLQPKAVLNR